MTSGNQCVLDCGVGFWNNSQSRICSQCHSTCVDCFGSSETSCLACLAPLILRPDKSCKLPCQVGFYPNDSSPTGCSQCNISCKECTGPTNRDCRSCQTTYKLTPDMRCVASCEEGTFESMPGICSNCFSSCKSCDRFGSRACLSCPPDRLHLKSVGSCVLAPCPDRTFMIS